MTTNNHPANGPVSLERLHQIRETLSKAAAQSDGGNLGYAMADAVKVIDGVIASFGAEPVGTFRKGPCGYYPSFHEDAVPLYAAPPVPVVPEEKLDEDGNTTSEFDHGWNACRSAMLQAGNSPVTPDGWIPVSERMPDPKRWLALYGQRVFTHGNNIGKPCEEPCVDQGYLGSDGKFYLLNWDYPGDIDDNSNNMPAIATHWMYWEMPAAPQQEVKGE